MESRDRERISEALNDWYETVPGNAELAASDPAKARMHMLNRKQLLGHFNDPDEAMSYLMDNETYTDLLGRRDETMTAYAALADVDTKLMGAREKREHQAATREAFMRRLDAQHRLKEYQERINREAARVEFAPDEYVSDSLGDAVKVGEYESGTREWLAARQGVGDRVCLGGSDIGAVLGVDEKYAKSNRDECLASKVQEYTADQETSFAQAQGNTWEPVILRDFQSRHPDAQVLHTKATWANRDNPENQINVDGLISSRGDGVPDGVFEAKTASDVSKWRDADGNPKVPDGYRAQALWYLENTGLDYAYVGVRIDSHTYEEHRIERGEKINEKLGTIQDNADKLEEFREQVRAARRGETKPGRKMNPHPPVKPTNNVEPQIASFQGRSEDEVRAGVAERVAAGASYEDAVAAEMRAHPFNPEGLVVLDLETSTASPKTGEIIEIAYQRLDKNGDVAQEGSVLCSPDRRFLRERGTGMEEVHHISPDMVRGKPQFTSPSVQEKLRAELGEGSVIVAHNAAFEQRWLSQDAPGGDTFTYLDTMTLSKFFSPETPDNTLSSFAQAHGVEYVDAHRALNDVDMTRRALNNFAEKLTS